MAKFVAARFLFLVLLSQTQKAFRSDHSMDPQLPIVRPQLADGDTDAAITVPAGLALNDPAAGPWGETVPPKADDVPETRSEPDAGRRAARSASEWARDSILPEQAAEPWWARLRLAPVSPLAFCLVAMVCIVSLAAAVIALQYEDTVQQGRKELANISLMVAEDAEQKLFASKLVLESLSEYASRGPRSDAAQFRDYLSTPQAYQYMQDRVAGNATIDVATFVNIDGTVLNFTRSFPAARINLADRDYFKAHLVDASIETYYSIPVRNRGNGKWVFYLSRRIENPAGEMIGLVLVGVSVESFSNYYQRISEGMGEGSSISLYRNDFTLMTRWPMRDELVGKPNLNSATADVIARRRLRHDVVMMDSARLTEGNEPQRRVAAPRALERAPFIVTAVITEKSFLSRWHTMALTISLVTGLALILMLLAGRRMQGMFRQREADLKTAQQLRQDAQITAERLQRLTGEQSQAAQAIARLNASLELRVSDRTKALSAANQELEAYNYSVAHDLRTPLRLIVALSQVLNKRYGQSQDEEFRAMVDQITRSGKNMGELIDGLLAIARIGKNACERSRVELGGIAREVFQELTANGQHGTVRLDVMADMYAMADPSLMRAALSNLLSNALKYGSVSASPLIEFGMTQVGNTVQFHVRDNGAGFDMRSADKLFQPFQRLHGPTHFQGLGIGLATARRIIERHGGQIWANSSPGRGATFTFSLGPMPAESSGAFRVAAA